MKEEVKIPEDDSNLGLGVKYFPGKGRGIVAEKKSFKKGEFVVEYIGDLLTFKEWKKRETKYKESGEKGSFILKFKHNDKICFLDATNECTRLGRLVNHSRLNPNCNIKKVIIDQKPRVILVANQNIALGTEIVYDYGDRDPASIKHYPWLSKIQELKMSETNRGKPAKV